MTNREYIVSILDRYSVSGDTVDAILEKNSIDGSATAVDYTGLDTAICRFLPFLFGTGSFSEGDASKTFNLDGLQNLYYFLCGQLGIEPVIEKTVIVRNISNRW
jgi:hypothetical protein